MGMSFDVIKLNDVILSKKAASGLFRVCGKSSGAELLVVFERYTAKGGYFVGLEYQTKETFDNFQWRKIR